jgi:hypothetical protein
MTSRTQNERKFAHWHSLENGERLYWLDVPGKMHWRARYLKQVDANEQTVRFWQEIYDADGCLVEIHEKYPIDLGHNRITEPGQ